MGFRVEGLTQPRDVLEAGEPEERKAAVRAFLEGIQIDKTARRAILRWYRLPQIDSLKIVELRGDGLNRSAALDVESLALPT